MLKINLLPVRQLKKRAKAKTQLFGIIFLFILVLALLAGVGFLQARNIKSLESTVAELTAEKRTYDPILKEMEILKKAKLELERKTSVIENLEADSSLTVRVLDEVATIVDNNRMWITSLKHQQSSLTLVGVALDNQTIAQFMDNLKASPFVQGVSLKSSAIKKISGRNLKAFTLNCSVSQPKPKEAEKLASK